jgi:hypothetical protein
MNIWNRAERVSEELMPSRIIECFAAWKAEEMAKLDSLIKQRKEIEVQYGKILIKQCKEIEVQYAKIKHHIECEEINLESAVTKFNNRKKVA